MKSVKELVSVFARHGASVTPGQPLRLTEAHAAGDGCSQGDLDILIVDKVPSGYKLVKKPIDADRQLVPESGGGSHHRLQSFEGVTLYRRDVWGKEVNDLRGPCIVFDQPNAIVHEPGHDKGHGTVFIDAPMTVVCAYQRNLDAEQRAARAQD